MASSLAPSLSLLVPASCGQHQRRLVVCQAFEARQFHRPDSAKKLDVNRRQLLSAAAASGLFLLSLSSAALALLEDDEDEQLLEKVKEDRKKKIQKRGEVNSFKEETDSNIPAKNSATSPRVVDVTQDTPPFKRLSSPKASVQAAVYQLSKAGQALDGKDFSSASQALRGSLNEGWIANVEKALSKVSSTMEEQSEAEVFSSALASLQSAVIKQDFDLSKSAFVMSAGALEKWSYLTGFAEQLKGL